MNFDIIQFHGKDFLSEFPNFSHEFPAIASRLRSDNRYIVRILLVDGRIQGLECGYPDDSWHIKLPEDSSAPMPAA